jgi:hypothetical protein
MQIFESGSEGFEAACLQKVAHADFDARTIAQRCVALATGTQRRNNIVLVEISLHHLVDFDITGIVDCLDQIAHPVTIHIISKFYLSLDLVAFGHGYITHVVAKACNFCALPISPRGRSTRPHAQLHLHIIIPPMTNNDLALQSHAAANEAKLTVTMCCLIEIHEIHVNLSPGNFAIVLRVQMCERLFEQAQPGNPHLGGRERVHPGNETNTVLG